MDLRKIGLYLAGKLPPYYGESQKLFFIRQLRALASQHYTNEEIEFIDRQAKGDDEKFYGMILQDLKSSSQRSFGEFVSLLSLPDDIILPTEADSSSTSIVREKINPDKVITQYIHQDLKGIFAGAIEIGKFDGLSFEAIKIFNERLKTYATKRGLPGLSENELVNTLFAKTDLNIFKFDLLSDSGNAQNDGLKGLMNGLFSYFRNPGGHELGFIKTKEDFIHLLLFISMLLKVLDEKGIS